MDIRKVKKLIELLEESGVAEIEIREGEDYAQVFQWLSNENFDNKSETLRLIS
jgi:acetyl-CoA carboxylase biotin carboxyl carrier protein